MTHHMLIVTTLALTTGALGSCTLGADPGPTQGPFGGTTLTSPDRAITCQHFANFQQDCTSSCSSTWDCEASYDSLDIDTQITLDDCSDCLAQSLAVGSCADCSGSYVGSCQQFMDDLLGVSCW